MSREDAGSTMITLLVGAAVGAGLGLLLAPRSGKETREKLKDWLDDHRDLGEELLAKVKDAIPKKHNHVEA